MLIIVDWVNNSARSAVADNVVAVAVAGAHELLPTSYPASRVDSVLFSSTDVDDIDIGSNEDEGDNDGGVSLSLQLLRLPLPLPPPPPIIAATSSSLSFIARSNPLCSPSSEITTIAVALVVIIVVGRVASCYVGQRCLGVWFVFVPWSWSSS